MSRPVVAVIGAGFSGLLTSLNLLRLHPRIEVRLIEKRSEFGLGPAYATGNPKHLVNVRLCNMSAFPDHPHHLSEWLAQQPGWAASDDFITRGSYGKYLSDLLYNTTQTNGEGDRLTLVNDTAKTLAFKDGIWKVELEKGMSLKADAVVLAQGNLAPIPPAGLEPDVVQSPRYLNEPWTALEAIPKDADDILLIGSGLTMVDAAISLRRTGRRFTAVSRRGFLPRSHGTTPMAPPRKRFEGSPLSVYRQVRQASRAEDWRAVVDDIRQSARSLWASWTTVERSRFLRHLRVVWDNHRHRLAPAVSREVTAMLASEELSIEAARVLAIRTFHGQVQVDLRLRGEQSIEQRCYDAVINCSGPGDDVTSSSDPLLRSLLKQGLVTPAPLGLGLALDENGRLRDQDYRPHSHLFAIGPLTRSLYWEASAVPDLREQAVFIAQQVIAAIDGSQALSESHPRTRSSVA